MHTQCTFCEVRWEFLCDYYIDEFKASRCQLYNCCGCCVNLSVRVVHFVGAICVYLYGALHSTCSESELNPAGLCTAAQLPCDIYQMMHVVGILFTIEFGYTCMHLIAHTQRFTSL
jgi:hypothetical protein